MARALQAVAHPPPPPPWSGLLSDGVSSIKLAARSTPSLHRPPPLTARRRFAPGEGVLEQRILWIARVFPVLLTVAGFGIAREADSLAGLGVAICAVGVALCFGQSGWTLDERTLDERGGTLTKWWKVLVTVHERTHRLTDFDSVVIESDTHGYTIQGVGVGGHPVPDWYSAHLAGPSGSVKLTLDIKEPYGRVRQQAREVARRLGLPLVDRAHTANVWRRPDELDLPLLARWRSAAAPPPETTEVPSGVAVEHLEGGGLRIRFPHPNRYGAWTGELTVQGGKICEAFRGEGREVPTVQVDIADLEELVLDTRVLGDVGALSSLKGRSAEFRAGCVGIHVRTSHRATLVAAGIREDQVSFLYSLLRKTLV